MNKMIIQRWENFAEEIAEKLGEGWKVIDVSEEAAEADERLLKAIFGEE